jgi:gliding motility-associated-like protein
MKFYSKLLVVLALVVLVFQQCKKPQNKTTGGGACDDPVFYADSLWSVIIPTAFTPNGDGNNDSFWVFGLNLSGANFDLSITELNGPLVFHSTNITDAWDGTDLNGLPCTAYQYTVHVQFTDNQNQLIDTCSYLYLVPSASGCTQTVAADVSRYFFEDQFDPYTGDIGYHSRETFCP